MTSKIANVKPDPNDIRPIVPTGSVANWSIWLFGAVLLIGGGVLFNALEASRQAAKIPNVLVQQGDVTGRIASPVPLRIPDRFFQADLEDKENLEIKGSSDSVQFSRVPQETIISAAPPQYVPPPSIHSMPPPRVIYDNGRSLPLPTTSSAGPNGEDRVSAERFANPSSTIPKGAIIPAVLETALDSTRPGGVRALVQRDVLGFDGTRVLIQRGSRLYGEYEADLQSGQKRAKIQWTRLIRPDGIMIALESPASDPLGRAGVKGKVDSKFLQRFGGAILQSVLDIGVGIATRKATDGVIVALPGSTQNVRVQEPGQIQPTLKVKHGTSVSVFVANDLDFSTVEL